ncbi:MAG TPA: laccase domain-containing protein [Ilumatobacteraceae bacterium]|nr:laccase domain-containing protein [Ilumatobacteraceae bacterium]
MLELLRYDLGACVAVVTVSERSDGDVHPVQVLHDTLVARQLAATASRWVMLDQVHGVVQYRSGPGTPLTSIVGVGDVLVGEAPIEGRVTRPVAVWAADCAPVMLFDRHGVPVACHAGWRGLAAGVIDVAAAAVARPVVAVVGPCIHPCCYEFGERELADVAAGVGADVEGIAATTSSGALALDVPAAVTAALARHDIDVVIGGACTACDDRWFSHRRGDVERHAMVGWSEVAS